MISIFFLLLFDLSTCGLFDAISKSLFLNFLTPWFLYLLYWEFLLLNYYIRRLLSYVRTSSVSIFLIRLLLPFFLISSSKYFSSPLLLGGAPLFEMKAFYYYKSSAFSIDFYFIANRYFLKDFLSSVGSVVGGFTLFCERTGLFSSISSFGSLYWSVIEGYVAAKLSKYLGLWVLLEILL